MKDQIIAGAIGGAGVLVANFLLNALKHRWDKQALVRQHSRQLHKEKADHIYEIIGGLYEFLECSDQAIGCWETLQADNFKGQLEASVRGSLQEKHQELFFQCKKTKWRCRVLSEKYGSIPVAGPHGQNILLAQSISCFLENELDQLLSARVPDVIRRETEERTERLIIELRELAKLEIEHSKNRDLKKLKLLKPEDIKILLELYSEKVSSKPTR